MNLHTRSINISIALIEFDNGNMSYLALPLVHFREWLKQYSLILNLLTTCDSLSTKQFSNGDSFTTTSSNLLFPLIYLYHLSTASLCPVGHLPARDNHGAKQRCGRVSTSLPCHFTDVFYNPMTAPLVVFSSQPRYSWLIESLTPGRCPGSGDSWLNYLNIPSDRLCWLFPRIESSSIALLMLMPIYNRIFQLTVYHLLIYTHHFSTTQLCSLWTFARKQ